MGKMKGQKVQLMRQMAAAGEFGAKPPPRTTRKVRVTPTRELCAEMIERYSQGEFMAAICAGDDRFPTDRAFRKFVGQDPELQAEWIAVKECAAEASVARAHARLYRSVKGPDGREDSGIVQRDRAIADLELARAAALDPARWSRKSEQTIVGDAARPVTVQSLTAPEVHVRLLAIFREAEESVGLVVDETKALPARLKAIEATGEPLSPELYEAAYPESKQ